MTLHKNSRSVVLNNALEKKEEKRKKISAARGIRIWSATKVLASPPKTA